MNNAHLAFQFFFPLGFVLIFWRIPGDGACEPVPEPAPTIP